MATRIVNKNDFYDFVQKNNDANHMAVVALDIDSSKEMFGPVLDDEMVKVIFASISASFEAEIMSKLGRDCFGIIVTKKERINVFGLAAHKQWLQQLLKQRIEQDMTFCMGISISERKRKWRDELISLALEALFQAKRRGSNAIEVWSEKNMKLKSYYFRRVQLERLSYYCQKNNVTEAAVIRRALDQFLDNVLI